MKALFKNPTIISTMIIALFLGFFACGFSSQNVIEGYAGMMLMLVTRYVILFLCVWIDFIVFQNINHLFPLFRYKSLFHFQLKNSLIEFIMCAIFVFIFHLPLVFIYGTNLLPFFELIVLNIISIIVLMTLFNSIIRFVNAFTYNRVLASIIVVIMITCLDFMIEYGNYFVFQHDVITFGLFMILPFKMPHLYFFIDIIMLISSVLLTTIASYIMARKDFALKNDEKVC